MDFLGAYTCTIISLPLFYPNLAYATRWPKPQDSGAPHTNQASFRLVFTVICPPQFLQEILTSLAMLFKCCSVLTVNRNGTAHCLTEEWFTTDFGESARLLEQIGESREDFLTIGEQGVLHSETKLSGIEDAETEEVKPSPSVHLPFQAFKPIDLPFNLSLGTNCQLHLIATMVSMTSPSPIPFIHFVVKPFLCCRSALPGEKSACSFSIHRPSRSAPCP
jgi:hypothetical protein